MTLIWSLRSRKGHKRLNTYVIAMYSLSALKWHPTWYTLWIKVLWPLTVDLEGQVKFTYYWAQPLYYQKTKISKTEFKNFDPFMRLIDTLTLQICNRASPLNKNFTFFKKSLLEWRGFHWIFHHITWFYNFLLPILFIIKNPIFGTR